MTEHIIETWGEKVIFLHGLWFSTGQFPINAVSSLSFCWMTAQNSISYRLIVDIAAKLLQSCLTLCDPIDGSPPGSPVPGILQARTLEWVAISFSNAWKWKVKVKSLSHVWLLATPWTTAYQASPSMGFSRQEYWSGVPLPSSMFMAKNTLKNLQTNKQRQQPNPKKFSACSI